MGKWRQKELKRIAQGQMAKKFPRADMNSGPPGSELGHPAEIGDWLSEMWGRGTLDMVSEIFSLGTNNS